MIVLTDTTGCDDAPEQGAAVASDPIRTSPTPPRVDPVTVDAIRSLRRPLRWSAATAAFQIEGARTAGGRGRSIWDDFVDTPGNVLDGSSAQPGPDSWHRWADDVELLRSLAVDRYRFSVSWVRVQPKGRGAAHQHALDTYRALVDALLEIGIEPSLTLYHWDLPAELEAAGGWLNRDTAFRFADYARHVVDALGDRVHHWYTINEPVSTTLQGYAIGELAPARRLLFGALPTVHHQLLAHGLAQQVVRSAGAGEVGIVNNHTTVIPASENDADLEAAGLYDLLHNRLFADPLLTGAYPPEAALLDPAQPVMDGDLDIIGAPSDFYGVNYYNPTRVGAPPSDGPIPFQILPIETAPTTGFGWPVVPEALTELLVDLGRRYGQALPPLIVAENGASYPEPDRVDGPIFDIERISYLDSHVRAVVDAVRAGADVREYTVWSLLDNFEWAHGFSQRFGLVHVDQRTSRRTPKTSYLWYRELIERVRA
jgi:beta-glucosidase